MYRVCLHCQKQPQYLVCNSRVVPDDDFWIGFKPTLKFIMLHGIGPWAHLPFGVCRRHLELVDKEPATVPLKEIYPQGIKWRKYV